MKLTLTTPVQYVPRVGPVMAKRLEKLSIYTVQDLLYHIPFRYNDYSLITPINRIQAGETVTIHGQVTAIRNGITKNGKKLQQASVGDETGKIDLTWFNQPFLVKIIHKGDHIRVSGKADWYGHTLVIQSPEYEIVADPQGPSLHTGRLVPVYAETAGVSSKWLRGRIAYALEQLDGMLADPLPETIRKNNRLQELPLALRYIHFPDTPSDAETARTRIAFDELFLLHLRAYTQRRLWETTQRAPPMKPSPEGSAQFQKNLPFQLTDDQQRAIDDILLDLTKPIPANRLLEGDVGSGKTVVAAAAMHAVYANGLKSLLMAPTEILATQHYQTLERILAPLGLAIGLVTGSRKLTPAQAKKLDVIVGTHAVLTQSFTMSNLGLVVVDEQQRFGVKQRLALRQKETSALTPHLLTMTATPIPRTIALTLWGNLDLSVIHQMPVGRLGVKTWLVPPEKRDPGYVWIRNELKTHKTQAFVICPLVEESETLTTAKAATAEFKRLVRDVFPDLRLALLHGRMKPKEKTTTLADFAAGRFDILVATPVVEVGIDIPNATIMLIEAADRFGLGQLHQLRGRVGRGEKQSYCLLFTDSAEEKTTTRLKALETTHSGPKLAEIDLALRGPGELFGLRQHGVPMLRVARFSDTAAIAQTKRAATALAASDPDLRESPHLRELLKKGTITASQD